MCTCVYVCMCVKGRNQASNQSQAVVLDCVGAHFPFHDSKSVGAHIRFIHALYFSCFCFTLSIQVQAVLASGVDLSLLHHLKKPLRATWVTTDSYTALVEPHSSSSSKHGDDNKNGRNDVAVDDNKNSSNDGRGNAASTSSGDGDAAHGHSSDAALGTVGGRLPELEPVDRSAYTVVVCVCASPPVDVQDRGAFVYVQGAADDEETWSLGLTPQLFWQHKSQLLAGNPALCPERVRLLVQQHQQRRLQELGSCSSHDPVLIQQEARIHPIGECKQRGQGMLAAVF